jgi:hypothetical protein
MNAHVTITDDRETELLADRAGAELLRRGMGASGRPSSAYRRGFQGAWYRVAERAKELEKVLP